MNIIQISSSLLMLAMTAAATRSAARFDLNCTGIHSAANGRGEVNNAYTTRYRIDLDSAKWCDRECRESREISNIRSDRLVLQIKNINRLGERAMMALVVDRRTGAHMISQIAELRGNSSAFIMSAWEGKCKRAGFSGFSK